MANETFQIPKIIAVDAEEFYADELHEALESVQASGKRALYVPELVDARIASPKESIIWKRCWTSPSIKATGRTRQGNAVVVYAHVPNYFSDPKNIKNSLDSLRNGAGPMPQSEFQRLLDLEDNEYVFVVDHSVLRCSESGVVSVKDALKYPQVVPFLGGKERAGTYLEKGEPVFGKNMGVWHSDDLDESTPLGRLLFLGEDSDGLIGSANLYVFGRFLGVQKSAGGGASKIILPSLEQVLKVANDYVPLANQVELEKRLGALYKK
jgi:hypothetical protein